MIKWIQYMLACRAAISLHYQLRSPAGAKTEKGPSK
jgi:hypothetical protein